MVSRLNAIRLTDIHIDSYQLVLVLIAIPLLLLGLDVYPQPWYDEGYSMQVSRLLMDEGMYGTYNATEGYRPFDPTISTGPTVILPMTLAFRYLGVGVAQARLIIVLYALLAIYGTYLCVSYFYGKNSALFITLFLFLLVLPQFDSVNFVRVSRQVLGETPAFALAILGLYVWFRSWDRSSFWLSLFAGALLGLGVLTKPQIVFGLFPALGLIMILRTIEQRSEFVYYVTPLVMIVVIFGAWTLIQRLATTPDIRGESSVIIAEAMRLHFFTGLFGSNLSRTAIVYTALMGLTACLTAWRVNGQRRKTGMTNVRWGEATFVMIIVCTAVWFALFSVGFERYSFLPILLTAVLLGKLVFDLLIGLAQRINFSPIAAANTATALLVLIVLGVNGLDIFRNFRIENNLMNMADYINGAVPQDAVVESLEVELNSLASRREYHRANYHVIYEAIDQRAIKQRAFDLDYDMLQADPDFLIIGGMGEWLELYDPAVIEKDFRQLVSFGIYRLYERVRTETASRTNG